MSLEIQSCCFSMMKKPLASSKSRMQWSGISFLWLLPKESRKRERVAFHSSFPWLSLALPLDNALEVSPHSISLLLVWPDRSVPGLPDNPHPQSAVPTGGFWKSARALLSSGWPSISNVFHRWRWWSAHLFWLSWANSSERQDCKEVPAVRFSQTLWASILAFKMEEIIGTIITIIKHVKSISNSFIYINSLILTIYESGLSLSLSTNETG